MNSLATSHKAQAISIWGTSSNVGKSLFCAGLGRLLSNNGIRVVPFKAQNMSNNSAVTVEGGEIGRAQACQADACRVPVINDLNPLLLKPTGDKKSQVVLHGAVSGTIGSDFGINRLEEFKRVIANSYKCLASNHDVILIEGAGGCAELNLRHRDLANEWITHHTNARVILVGDIERGGVFASLLGSLDLLPPSSKERVIGMVVNKFRGAPELFEEGVRILEERSGIPVLGVLPYIDHHLPDEDGASFQSRTIRSHHTQEKTVRVGIIMTPHISNSTDVESLIADPRFAVELLYEPAKDEIDLLILPGSKNVLEDLVHLKNKGFVAYLIQQYSRRKHIIGICGGYQMLGTIVQDPYNVESNLGSCEGMGLLDIETIILPQKVTKNVKGIFVPNGKPICGYEIHCGQTKSNSTQRSLIHIWKEQSASCSRDDGFITPDGLVMGTYLHGLFDNDSVRNWLCEQHNILDIQQSSIPDPYDSIATAIERHLDLSPLYTILNQTNPIKTKVEQTP